MTTKLAALKQATQKANDYAVVIDQNIGKAIYIKENSNHYITPSLEYAKASVGQFDMEAVNDIDFKKIVISENIQAKFILD